MEVHGNLKCHETRPQADCNVSKDGANFGDETGAETGRMLRLQNRCDGTDNTGGSRPLGTPGPLLLFAEVVTAAAP